MERKPLNHSFKNCKLLRIGWTVVDKSRPEQDPKWTRLCYLLPTRPEVAGDVISGENVKIAEGYALLNFESATVSSFQENKNQQAHFSPIFWVKEQNFPIGLTRQNEALESQFPKL